MGQRIGCYHKSNFSVHDKASVQNLNVGSILDCENNFELNYPNTIVSNNEDDWTDDKKLDHWIIEKNVEQSREASDNNLKSEQTVTAAYIPNIPKVSE